MTNASKNLLDYIHFMVSVCRDDPRDDTQLLALFVQDRDERAFKTLLGRHGSLVWRTCTRVLGDGPEAEDAFQAAFLALARKASHLRGDTLAGWLHQVARQAALNADAEFRRRRSLEHRLREVKQPESVGRSADQVELYAVLDEELASLPEQLRVPLLLHYLEGKSQDEVAHILGCTRAMARRRLARGEAMLRQRLERRGLEVGVVAVGALLEATAGASAVPARLIGSTARAAVAFHSGTLTGGAAEAARVVLETLPSSMGMTILWKNLWIVLACCLGLGSAALVTYRCLSAQPDEPGEAGPVATQAPGELGVSGRAAGRVDCYGDPLPAGTLVRMGTVRQWYGGRQNLPLQTVLAFSPDDKTLVSRSEDGSVCLWDAATGREMRWIAKNSGAGIDRWPRGNTLLALSPDGQTLAKVQQEAEGNEGIVYLWQVATGKLLHKLKRSQEPKREAGFVGITFLPNGKILTLDEAKDSDNRIYLWDVATGGREISQLKDRRKDLDIYAVAFSRDGKMVAAVEPEGVLPANKIQLWEVATGKKIRQLRVTGKKEFFLSMAFSPDSKTLAFCRTLVAGGGGSDTMICVQEVASGKPLHQFKIKTGGMGPPCPLIFSPDGKTLLGGSKGHLWDVATGKEIRSFGWKDAKVAVFSPSGKVLAVGDWAGVIRLWEVATGKEILPHKGHQDRVTSIAYSPDGKTLASLSQDKTVRLWEAATGKEIRQLTKHTTWIWGSGSLEYSSSSLAYSPDGKMLVSMDKDVIHLWDTTTGEEIRQLRGKREDPLTEPSCFEDVALVGTFSPDGKLLAATLGEQTVCLWQIATGKLIHTLPTKRSSSDESWSVAFSPDGRSLIVPGKNGAIDLWKVATGKHIDQLPLIKQGQKVQSLAFSPDGRILATSSYGGRAGDGKVHLWEVATGKEICQLKGRNASCYQGRWLLTFSPDGKILATVERVGWKDKKIHLWEVATGKEIGQLSGHRSTVRCVAFSPDSKTLASGSDDLTCLVWDLTSVGRLTLPPRALSQEKSEAAWADLAKDPAKAYAAIWTLQAVPTQALALLQARVRLVAPADPQQLNRWIADLDANNFAVREKAQREIGKLGKAAIPALRQALKGQPELEAKQRLKALLAELEPKGGVVSPRSLREFRAVQVLEYIGTAEARQVLQVWAKGVAEARLSQESEAALARLAKRSVAKP